MINLVPLVEKDDLSTWKSIVESKNEKRRSRLKKLEPLVRERYTEYNTLSNSLASLAGTTLTEKEGKDCLHCYQRETKPLADLKARIELQQAEALRGLCGFCGWEADSFDHYIPEGAFPEFCVLAKNLVPCCTACNRLKGGRWIKDGRRLILGLYQDGLPVNRAVKLQVNVKGAKVVRVTFEPIRYAGVSDAYWEIWERTWSLLKLSRRFAKRSNGIVSEVRDELASLSRPSIESARKLLHIQAKRKARVFGIHYWHSVLLEGLAESDEFLLFCIAKAVPDASATV